MSYICSDCGDKYKRIGQHWSLGSCNPPDLSSTQIEILTGLMMGDGTISKSSAGNVCIEANMVNYEYLTYLDEQFPVLGRGIHCVNTAEDNARRDRESGFNPDANPDNYSDTYRWKTMTSSVFNRFGEWYNSGSKVWPDRPFTPISLKHLYCCDGYRHKSGSHDNITISMNNELDKTDKVEQMFESAGLPTPEWQIYEKNGRQDCTARFTKADSVKLWEYMGDPLPGFEHKWR